MSAISSLMTASSPQLDARWLDALSRLVSRSAHELKGALNGVSVNQEVIRSRVEKGNVTASSLSSFAAAAGDQLDVVISLTEALLGLTRRGPNPTEIGIETRRIAILLSAVARSDGRQLTFDDAATLNALGATSAPGSAVRLAICESLLAAVETNTNVHCSAVAEPGAPSLRIQGDGNAMPVRSDIVVATADVGITIRAEPSAVRISFPR